jgi:hypothetical protein
LIEYFGFSFKEIPNSLKTLSNAMIVSDSTPLLEERETNKEAEILKR